MKSFSNIISALPVLPQSKQGEENCFFTALQSAVYMLPLNTFSAIIARQVSLQ